MIELINPINKSVIEKTEHGYIDSNGRIFPLVNGVLRLVEEGNYTDSFGFQWNKFQKTQIDTEKNNLFSKARFFAETGWDKENLEGKNVLEVGSGAGRFTQIVLDYTRANLYSVDYSSAVFANYRNNGHHGDRLRLFQASIYELPFPDNTFDKIFCFGVLQHTPDFKKSVKCLIDKASPGGEVVVDFYTINGWWTKIHAKYLFRPITKKISHKKLLSMIDRNIDWLMKLYYFFEKIGIGRFVNRFLPICNIKGTLPANLSKKDLREWVVLDTFDMFSPEHDHPQKISTVSKWFREYGMEVTFAGMVTYSDNFEAAIVKGIKK